LKNTDLMVIKIDSAKCQGHNRCYALAPNLVDVDDFGQAQVRGDGVVPAELHATASLLVANCPEFAIELVPLAQDPLA
jgi:ferredoxin